MDLNHLLHRHQTALIRGAAATCATRQNASARTAAQLGAVISLRQQELGATFALIGAAR